MIDDACIFILSFFGKRCYKQAPKYHIRAGNYSNEVFASPFVFTLDIIQNNHIFIFEDCTMNVCYVHFDTYAFY